MSSSLAILYVTSEAAPLVKVGGLADVAMALPPALMELGVHVDLALPLHGAIKKQNRPLTLLDDVPPFVLFGRHAQFFRLVVEETGVTAWLVGNDDYFDRPHPYTTDNGRQYGDSLERDVFFQRALLHLCAHFHRTHQRSYDIIHANDHQTALLPLYLKETPAGENCGRPLCVLTIHNLGYQGVYPDEPDAVMDAATVSRITGLPDFLYYPLSPMEFWGKLNCLKAGIEYADGVSTVSPTYAREIQTTDELGFGLQNVLRANRHKLRGILNGVDTSIWNPRTDPLLPALGAANFSVSAMEGKLACKRRLFERFKLPLSRLSRPLFGCISRLVHQKGVDLIAEALPYILAQDAFAVFLGNGPDRDLLQSAIAKTPGKAGLMTDFDESLSHLISAGSDFFLMPSRYEPCGLNQMYSMVYGTFPIVRKTGGLADTVTDLDKSPEQGTGFVFEPYDRDSLLGAATRAVSRYNRDRRLDRLRQRIMLQDFSWLTAAHEYLLFYGETASRIGRLMRLRQY